MYVNQVFELSMELDGDKFHKVIDKVISREGYLEEIEDGYIDQSLASKGILVKFRDSQYKKKIKLIVEPRLVLGCNTPDPDRLIRKLDKRIGEYFGYKYRLDDFNLSEMILSTDIRVGNRDDVSAYLKVLKRIRKVKGFSPSGYDCFGEDDSFCLDGNSNGIEFLIYDLEKTLTRQLRDTDISRKKLKSMMKGSKGILRVEVRLRKPKAIRTYTKTTNISSQITELSENCRDIFLDIFAQIIPYGDFHKKGKAVELVQMNVKDKVTRRKMLRLLELIPEKKSLYLAQKSMNCRDIEKVMDAFAKINLSPVTISKRQDIKCLKCIYDYLVDDKN